MICSLDWVPSLVTIFPTPASWNPEMLHLETLPCLVALFSIVLDLELLIFCFPNDNSFVVFSPLIIKVTYVCFRRLRLYGREDPEWSLLNTDIEGKIQLSVHASTQRSFSTRESRMLCIKLFWKLPFPLPTSFEHFSMSGYIESYDHWFHKVSNLCSI